MENMDIDLDDPRIILLEEIMSNHNFFPPINNSNMGKATGTLVRNLINNYGNIGSRTEF
jgi:hypothetical protein